MNMRQLIPAAGLAATIALSAYMVVQLNAQAAPLGGDFSSAVWAEVRDAQGQTVLRGEFATNEEDDDDVERKAALAPTGADTDASGEAEVEFSKGSPAAQEIEFSVRNLAPGSNVTFVIDGTEVGSATVNGRGEAEVDVESSTGATAPR